MATYYSQGSDLWSTLTNWDTNAGGGGTDPASVAAMDDDTFIIQAGHVITMDADMSGFANGIAGLTITGIAAGTPGTLRFYNGTNGFLKIKLGTTILGTDVAVYGRILANSDGDWATATPLTAANKAIISLRTTAKIVSKWLDIKLYCTQPTTYNSVRTYGQIFHECTVSAAGNTLTFTGIAAALPNTRLVRVTAGSGALPAELSAGTDYWVVGASGNTIQLSLTSGGAAIDLSAGGPINVHCGWYANWGITGNTLTKTTHGLANGTAVCVRSSGTLPTPLAANTIYYVVSTAANAISLALTSGGTALTLGGSPSGTLDVYSGSTGAAPGLGGTNPYTSTMVNVLDDVSGDSTVWVAGAGTFATTTVQNAIVLADAGPANYDQQRLAFSAVTATTMTLSAAVDSIQYPNARIWLCSRNVAIQSSCVTSVNIIDSTSGTTNIGIFECEIRSTAGTGTTFYGYGIYLGSGHTISGTVSGCSIGIYSGSGHTISGTVSGCNYGFNYGSGHTISGTVSGCNYGFNSGSGHTLSGTVSGCNYAIYLGSGHTISGTVSGCGSAIYYGSGHTISGTISGCNNGIYSGSGHTISGTVSGCTSGIYLGSGYTISGTVSGCSYSFRDAVGHIKVLSGADVTYSFYARNVIGQRFRIAAEDHGLASNAYKVYDNVGDIIKTACDGATANYPDEDPDAGSGYAIEVSNLQQIISATNPLYLISDRSPHRIWLAADTWTITYKVYTTFTAGILDNGLIIAATYISAASPLARTRSTDSQAIALKTSDTDWTQTISIAITNAVAGWVDIDMYLTEYESGKVVFVWPTPTIVAS